MAYQQQQQQQGAGEQQQQSRSSGMFSSATNAIKETAPERLTWCMRITNLINSGLLIASGVVTFLLLGSCSDDCRPSILAVIAFYAILFGLLLCVFELRVESRSQQWISRNCGFMYSNRGKALLLLFLATMAFSMVDSTLNGSWWFAILVGVFTTLNGVFACAVVYMNPGYDEYTKTHGSSQPSGSARGSASTASTSGPAAGAGAGYASQSDYTFGDANAGAYSTYDLQQPQPRSQSSAAYSEQRTSTPFAQNQPQPPPPPSDNPFSSENPFSNV